MVPARMSIGKGVRISNRNHGGVRSTNRRADPAQIEGIMRFVGGSTFDEEPLPGMNSEVIDFRVHSECFASIRKLRRSDLRTLQLTAIHQNHEAATVGGFLLFGSDRRATFPDSYMRAGCFFIRFAYKQKILFSGFFLSRRSRAGVVFHKLATNFLFFAF
jgi:ATP-dependent DNA helicase RecG